MNFAVCPYDGARLKALQRPSESGGRLIANCPACGKRFTLGPQGPVEISTGGDDAAAW